MLAATILGVRLATPEALQPDDWSAAPPVANTGLERLRSLGFDREVTTYLTDVMRPVWTATARNHDGTLATYGALDDGTDGWQQRELLRLQSAFADGSSHVTSSQADGVVRTSERFVVMPESPVNEIVAAHVAAVAARSNAGASLVPATDTTGGILDRDAFLRHPWLHAWRRMRDEALGRRAARRRRRG